MLQMRLSPTVLRDTMLAKRWKQSELLEHGLIDEAVPAAQVLPRSIELATQEGAKVGLGTWGTIKDGLLHNVIDSSRSRRPYNMPEQDAAQFFARIKREKEAKAKL
jgi:enoyl-CoA hydratase/carnithine racemase